MNGIQIKLFIRRFVTAALFDGCSPNAADVIHIRDHRTIGFLLYCLSAAESENVHFTVSTGRVRLECMDCPTRRERRVAYG